jgi:hypothetical protein
MIHFILGCCLVLVASAQEVPLADKAKITFEKTSHDFGDIFQGDVVTYAFKFTNTGKEPLIISNVLVTCGCTAPSWPKEPIMPGKGGEIVISFNSSGKMGVQNKVITVMSNAINSQAQLIIKTNILPKPGDNLKNDPLNK